jgi:uncharacterized membrane protein
MLDFLLKRPYVKISPGGDIKVSDRADKPIKSFIKAVSWRVVGTIDTIVISYFITGKASFAISIGGMEVITKTVLYYFHERLWSHIHRLRINFTLKPVKKQYELDRIEQ